MSKEQQPRDYDPRSRTRRQVPADPRGPAGDGQPTPPSEAAGDDTPQPGETRLSGHPPIDEEEAAELEATTTMSAQRQGDESIVPGYRVLDKLGEGGMGVVFRAIQSSLNRTVALKIVKKRLSEQSDFLKRFRREALAGAKLNHPNIVSIYDYGVANGIAYMALEYVEGRNGQSAARQSALEPDFALKIVRDCVLGLSHANSQGLIHRDIKPANILLVEKGAEDARGKQGAVAKVADLGLAKNDKSENPELRRVTQIGLVLGTPEHMAPEQALGQDIDARCDMYALGSSFYYFLTAKQPFSGATAIEVMNKKLNDRAINPQDLAPDIDDGFIKVLDRMMARKAADRYPNYEELLNDIEAILRGETPRTPPVPATASSIAQRIRSKPLTSGKVRPKRVQVSKVSKRSVRIIVGACILLLAVSGFALWKFSGDAARAKKSARVEIVLPGGEEVQTWTGMLGSIYRAGDYEDLAKKLTDIRTPWDRAGTPLPAEIDRFDQIVKAAMIDDAGNKERKILAEVETTTDPDLKVRLLEAFEDRFGFSPDTLRVAEIRHQAMAAIAARKTATENELRITSLVDDLRARKADVLVDDAEGCRLTLAQALEETGVAEAFAATRRTEVDQLIADRAAEVLAERVTALTEVWSRADWDALAGKADGYTRPYAAIGRPVPEGLATFVAHAAAAAKDGAGKSERAAWAAILGIGGDPMALLAATAGFEMKFAFSPMLDQVAAKRRDAEAAAPALEIETDPSGAELLIGNKPVGRSKWSGRALRGPLVVGIRLPGHSALEVPFVHDGAKSHLFRLSPEPARPLKRRDVRKNVALSLKPFIEWRSVGTWTQPEDLGARAVLQGESETDGFSTTRVDTDDIVAKGRIFKDAPGWLLTWYFGRQSGAAEVRVLQGPAGECVVAGMDDDGFYVGTRNTTTGDFIPWTVGRDKPAKEVHVGLEWHGDVVRVILNVETQAAVTLASVRPFWTPSTTSTVELAVRNGIGRFGDLLLFPMYAD